MIASIIYSIVFISCAILIESLTRKTKRMGKEFTDAIAEITKNYHDSLEEIRKGVNANHYPTQKGLPVCDKCKGTMTRSEYKMHGKSSSQTWDCQCGNRVVSFKTN